MDIGGITAFHSLMRYLIIAVALWALIQLATGLNGKRAFRPEDKRPGLIFMILMDIQLLLGLGLYFMGQWGWYSIQNFGFSGSLQSPMTRFFAIEHETGMIIALILVHIGYFATKSKTLTDIRKFSRAFWLFLVALLFIISFIPWPFREALGRTQWI